MRPPRVTEPGTVVPGGEVPYAAYGAPGNLLWRAQGLPVARAAKPVQVSSARAALSSVLGYPVIAITVNKESSRL